MSAYFLYSAKGELLASLSATAMTWSTLFNFGVQEYKWCTTQRREEILSQFPWVTLHEAFCLRAGGYVFTSRSKHPEEPVAVTAAVRKLEMHDRVTGALMAAAVPKYRNSDLCPVVGCGRRGDFVRMALVCNAHGPFHGAR